jgi:methionyl-tRNA formyltransferase
MMQNEKRRHIMRILYLANNRVGWQVLQFLISRREDVVGLVVHPEERQKCTPEIIATSRLSPDRIYYGNEIAEESIQEEIRELKPDIGLSIYFGYLLSQKFLDIFPRGVINLHPAYLPYNRGVYPNVWSIIETNPAGVTLHYVDGGVDTGPVIAQEYVPVESTDTGRSLYRKLELSSVKLFKEIWPEVRAGKVSGRPQNPNEGTFHTKGDIEDIDRIDLDKSYRGRDLINIIRARTFPPYEGAYFMDGHKKVYLRISFQKKEF